MKFNSYSLKKQQQNFHTFYFTFNLEILARAINSKFILVRRSAIIFSYGTRLSFFVCSLMFLCLKDFSSFLSFHFSCVSCVFFWDFLTRKNTFKELFHVSSYEITQKMIQSFSYCLSQNRKTIFNGNSYVCLRTHNDKSRIFRICKNERIFQFFMVWWSLSFTKFSLLIYYFHETKDLFVNVM